MKTSLQKGTENKIYIVSLATIAILFVVFFTSRMWMYDDSPIAQSPFHTDIKGLEQTSLVLKKWEYDPEKELMEISIETKHTGDDFIKPTFTFSAKERDTGDEYPVKVVYQDGHDFVLQLKDVSNKHKVVGLFVYEHRDEKILENELKEKLNQINPSTSQDDKMDTDVDVTSVKPSRKVLVGDYRKIKINDELATKQAVDYQIENVNREIVQINKSIERIVKDKMPLQDDLVESLQADIISLKEEEEYQTEEEKKETATKISSKENSIKKAHEQKEEYEKSIAKLEEKRAKLFEKLDAILDEKNTDEPKVTPEKENEEDQSNNDKKGK